MKGLSSRLLAKIRKLLRKSDCANFEDHELLKSYFLDERISEWYDILPEAGSISERIDRFCFTFFQKYNRHGENGLALFFEVLRERAHENNSWCEQNLDEVVNELDGFNKSVVESLSTAHEPFDKPVPIRLHQERTGREMTSNREGINPNDVWPRFDEVNLPGLSHQYFLNLYRRILPKEIENLESPLMNWLKNKGFNSNPFDTQCWIAEHDDLKVGDIYISENISNALNNSFQPGAKYLLAPFGGGKTTLLNYMIKRTRDSSRKENHNLISIKYILNDEIMNGCWENVNLFESYPEDEVILFTHVQYIAQILWYEWYGYDKLAKLADSGLLPAKIDEARSALGRILLFCNENFKIDTIIIGVDIAVSQSSGIKNLCKQYLSVLGSLTIPGLWIKIFAPITMNDARDIGWRTDHEDVYLLEWSKSDLRKLLSTRIMSRHVSDLQQLDEIHNKKILMIFSDLFALEKKSTIVEEVIDFAFSYRSPRAMILLGHQIFQIHEQTLEEQFRRDDPFTEPLISADVVQQAIDRCKDRLI